jgi:uncharacterized protein
VILVDTNVLYALADRRDKHHARCAGWLQRTPDVLMVPATVLAETCYLIDRTLGPTAEAAFLDSVGTGPEYTFQLVELVDSDLRRMSGLVRQYADLRLGGTDQVPPRTHRDHDLTCGYVMGQDLARVRCGWFPQIRTMGVQVGLRLRNGNNQHPLPA